MSLLPFAVKKMTTINCSNTGELPNSFPQQISVIPNICWVKGVAREHIMIRNRRLITMP